MADATHGSVDHSQGSHLPAVAHAQDEQKEEIRQYEEDEREESKERTSAKELDNRGREEEPSDDLLEDHQWDHRAAEMFDVTDEELGEMVSKYAKVNQPVPFTSVPPHLRFNLEWHNVNYKVVIPLPPQSFILKMLFKLPIPRFITDRLKRKKEVPILNNVSGQVHAGQIVAIMGPTGSGKVPLRKEPSSVVWTVL